MKVNLSFVLVDLKIPLIVYPTFEINSKIRRRECILEIIQKHMKLIKIPDTTQFGIIFPGEKTKRGNTKYCSDISLHYNIDNWNLDNTPLIKNYSIYGNDVHEGILFSNENIQIIKGLEAIHRRKTNNLTEYLNQRPILNSHLTDRRIFR